MQAIILFYAHIVSVESGEAENIFLHNAESTLTDGGAFYYGIGITIFLVLFVALYILKKIMKKEEFEE